jgi:hypothetical protein
VCSISNFNRGLARNYKHSKPTRASGSSKLILKEEIAIPNVALCRKRALSRQIFLIVEQKPTTSRVLPKEPRELPACKKTDSSSSLDAYTCDHFLVAGHFPLSLDFYAIDKSSEFAFILIGRVSQARLELEGIIILYCTPLKMSE